MTLLLQFSKFMQLREHTRTLHCGVRLKYKCTMLDHALHRAGTSVHKCRQMLHCSDVQADIAAFLRKLRLNVAGFTDMSLVAQFMDTIRHCRVYKDESLP